MHEYKPIGTSHKVLGYPSSYFKEIKEGKEDYSI